VDKKAIKKIILFGSYAYGKPHKHSDIAICVIVPNSRKSRSVYLKLAMALFENKIMPLMRAPTTKPARWSALWTGSSPRQMRGPNSNGFTHNLNDANLLVRYHGKTGDLNGGPLKAVHR
jgi:hypothetical protein